MVIHVDGAVGVANCHWYVGDVEAELMLTVNDPEPFSAVVIDVG